MNFGRCTPCQQGQCDNCKRLEGAYCECFGCKSLHESTYCAACSHHGTNWHDSECPEFKSVNIPNDNKPYVVYPDGTTEPLEGLDRGSIG